MKWAKPDSPSPSSLVPAWITKAQWLTVRGIQAWINLNPFGNTWVVNSFCCMIKPNTKWPPS